MVEIAYGGGRVGLSAYEIYVEVQTDLGLPVLDKATWVNSFGVTEDDRDLIASGVAAAETINETAEAVAADRTATQEAAAQAAEDAGAVAAAVTQVNNAVTITSQNREVVEEALPQVQNSAQVATQAKTDAETARDEALAATLPSGSLVLWPQTDAIPDGWTSIGTISADAIEFYIIRRGTIQELSMVTPPTASPQNITLGSTIQLRNGTYTNALNVTARLLQGGADITDNVINGAWTPTSTGAYTWTVTATGEASQSITNIVSGQVAAPELWQPSDMTTAVAWWDAADATKMTVAGDGSVSAWVDRISGLTVAQANTANQPKYNATARNGKPGVVMTGGTQFLSAESSGVLPVGANPLSILISGYANETADFETAFSWGVQGTRGAMTSITIGTASIFPKMDQGGQNDPATAFWNNQDRCVVYTRTAGATGKFTFTFDGVDATGDNNGIGNSFFKAVQSGVLAIGNSPALGARAPNNFIAQQIVVTNSALTLDDRQKLEGWASWKTGKNGSNLPAGHPYKTAAPTKAAVIPDRGTILFAGDSMMEKSHVYAQEVATDLGFTDFLLEGDGGIRWEQWAGKMGSRPWQLTFPSNTIPASGSVVVSSTNQGTGVNNIIPFYGTAGGVAGRLSAASNNVTFTRTTSGEAVTLTGAVPFIPDLAADAKVVPSVQWIGTNNLRFGESGDALAQAIDNFVAFRTAQDGKVIVMGTFNATGTPADDARRTQTSIANTRLAATYGDHFIDVIDWLLTDAFTQMGRTPTTEDQAQLDLGNLPPSASTDGLHLNDAWYAALFRNVVKAKIAEVIVGEQ